MAVDGKAGAGKGCGTQGAFIDPRPAVREPRPVACDHFMIRHQVMAEGNRLGGLQVRETRHHGRGVLLSLVGQNRLQANHAGIDMVNGGAHPKPEIGRYLIVSGAPCVQPGACVADDLPEARLNMHMNVFKRRVVFHVSGFDFGYYLIEAFVDIVAVSGGDNTGCRQHIGVRFRAGDVFAIQPFVETNRRIYFLHDRRRPALEPAAPHALAVGTLAAGTIFAGFVIHHALAFRISPTIVIADYSVSNLEIRMSIRTLVSIALLAALLGVAAYRQFVPPTMFDPAPGPINSYLKGEMAKLTLPETPTPLSDHIIMREDGAPVKLSDMAGKAMLINLWASWCAPCRAEMKELANLQKHLGDDQFEVVAITVDRGGVLQAKETLAEWGIEGLALYAEPTMAIALELAEGALPTSYVVGKDGMVRASFRGPLKWDEPEALALFQALKDGEI